MTSSAGGAAVGDRQLPKILVTGASGLLGRQVMSELPGDSYEVRGIVHSRARLRCVQCDLTVDGEIARQIQDFRPDAVINLVAERRPDVVHKDPESANRKNVDLVKSLAGACREADAWLLHFSTDYVFDGTKPPYYETDTPNPLSVYGEQKLESEKVVMACAPEHGAILRVPLLFGPVETYKESAVTSLYEDAISGKMTKADHLQRRYPTCTEDVAKVVRRLVDLGLRGRRPLGCYHFQGSECLTKYDMAQAIGEVLGEDFSGVQPDKVAPPFPRPEDSRLDCSRLETLLGGAEAEGLDPTSEEAALRDKVLAKFRRWDSKGASLIEEDKLQEVLLRLGLPDGQASLLLSRAPLPDRDAACRRVDYAQFLDWLFREASLARRPGAFAAAPARGVPRTPFHEALRRAFQALHVSQASGAPRGEPSRRRPRILVIGASGLLGRQVMGELPEDSYEVRGVVYSRARPRCVQRDLTVDGEAARQIQDFRPSVVVNLAAERRPDAVHRDPASASKKNVGLVKALADACREADAWLLHFSTDYVFDGTKPPYCETDAPNPMSAYGEQKLESERLVTACAPEHGAILRIPLLFGPMEFCKESAVTSLYEDAVSGVMTKADHSQRRYPTCTEDVAKVVRRLIDLGLSGERPLGCYHWQSNECLTKYDMVQAIGEVLEKDFSGVQPDMAAPPFQRPEDSRLDCSKLEALLGGAEATKSLRTPCRDALRSAFRAFHAGARA